MTLVDDSLKIWFSSPPEVGRGICIRLSRFDLVDSGSEEFKAICNQYPITLQVWPLIQLSYVSFL